MNLTNTNQRYAAVYKNVTQLKSAPIIKPKPPPKKDNPIYEKFDINYKTNFEIFAYCSASYLDAYNFVINSWLLPNVTKITIYTDFDLNPHDKRIEIIPCFKNQTTDNWLIGTGRRLDAIKDYTEKRKNSGQNILFLDIDCYITKDVSHVFSKDFDISITRLFCTSSYADSTATAGLWFAKITPNFHMFINDWLYSAAQYKNQGRGVRQHHISYVQYSFTDIARAGLSNNKYKIMPLNERFYNSEHSDDNKWLLCVQKYKPHILHFKGRRFRKKELVSKVLQLSGVST